MLFVLGMLVATVLLEWGIFALLGVFGVEISDSLFVLLFFTASSILIGTALTAGFSSLVINPYKKLSQATNEIAAGNFDVRVDVKGAEEVVLLGESFNRMAKELGSIETMRSDFISNVSHEFKTPVASIKGFARLLKKDTLSQESRDEYLDIIIRESERLTQLSGNVLLLSKLEQQEIVTDNAVFLLDEQLRRAALLFEPEWSQKDIELYTELLDRCAYYGNEELWMQVWLNLIGNAVKFTEAGGRIDIALARRQAAIEVSIRDTGIGMDDEVLAHMFDKFYQGDTSHSTKGNGLGLSLVRRIVAMCGGAIEIESAPDEGTAVRVLLPETEVQQH